MCNDSCITTFGVIRPISSYPQYRFVGIYLLKQFWQYRCITCTVVRNFHGTYFQRVGINTYVYLAPLPSLLCTVLFCLPFAFTDELDTCTVHQQVQTILAGAVAYRHR